MSKARTRNLLDLPCCKSFGKVVMILQHIVLSLSLSELIISAMLEQIKGQYSAIISMSKNRPDDLRLYLDPRVGRNTTITSLLVQVKNFRNDRLNQGRNSAMIVKNKSTSHKLAVLPCAERFDKISVHIIRRPLSAFVIDIKLTILGMTGPIDGRNSTYDVHEQG